MICWLIEFKLKGLLLVLIDLNF